MVGLALGLPACNTAYFFWGVPLHPTSSGVSPATGPLPGWPLQPQALNRLDPLVHVVRPAATARAAARYYYVRAPLGPPLPWGSKDLLPSRSAIPQCVSGDSTNEASDAIVLSRCLSLLLW